MEQKHILKNDHYMCVTPIPKIQSAHFLDDQWVNSNHNALVLSVTCSHVIHMAADSDDLKLTFKLVCKSSVSET